VVVLAGGERGFPRVDLGSWRNGELVNENPAGRYRAARVRAGRAELVVQGDSAWKVSVVPVSARFSPVKSPASTQRRRRSADPDGAYGVATFDTQLPDWRLGVWSRRWAKTIKPDGDYRRNRVPRRRLGDRFGARPGQSSQAPCVEPPGL
jgi:hypothetical protein